MADIPLESGEQFELWLRERWYEKDRLMEEYMATGRFPSSPVRSDSAARSGSQKTVSHIETEVRTKHGWEFIQIFVVLGVFGLAANILAKIWYRVTHIFA